MQESKRLKASTQLRATTTTIYADETRNIYGQLDITEIAGRQDMYQCPSSCGLATTFLWCTEYPQVLLVKNEIKSRGNVRIDKIEVRQNRIKKRKKNYGRDGFEVKKNEK